MIEKCADVIAGWLIECSAVEEADRELYSYAVYSAFLTLSPLLLAIVFGLCMGCMKQSILIVTPFVIIRKFSGGYHAKHLGVCLFCSSLLLFLCIVLSFHLEGGWQLALAAAAAAVSLICFSPIDNENRVLSQKERVRYKKITAVLVVIYLLLDAAFFWFQLQTYAVCISIGIMLSAGLQLPCIFQGLAKI